MNNAGIVSINPADSLTVHQQAGAGAVAANTARDLATTANLGLNGLEAQVKNFYDLANKAEANKLMIEKFLLGTNCKTASIPEICLFAILPPPKRSISDFI